MFQRQVFPACSWPCWISVLYQAWEKAIFSSQFLPPCEEKYAWEMLTSIASLFPGSSYMVFLLWSGLWWLFQLWSWSALSKHTFCNLINKIHCLVLQNISPWFWVHHRPHPDPHHIPHHYPALPAQCGHQVPQISQKGWPTLHCTRGGNKFYNCWKWWNIYWCNRWWSFWTKWFKAVMLFIIDQNQSTQYSCGIQK